MKKMFFILTLCCLSFFTYSQSVEDYFVRGNEKFSLGDYRGSIADYNKVIELNPEHANAYYNRGNAKSNLGDKSGACLDWSKSGELGGMDAYEMIRKFCN